MHGFSPIFQFWHVIWISHVQFITFEFCFFNNGQPEIIESSCPMVQSIFCKHDGP